MSEKTTQPTPLPYGIFLGTKEDGRIRIACPFCSAHFAFSADTVYQSFICTSCFREFLLPEEVLEAPKPSLAIELTPEQARARAANTAAENLLHAQVKHDESFDDVDEPLLTPPPPPAPSHPKSADAEVVDVFTPPPPPVPDTLPASTPAPVEPAVPPVVPGKIAVTELPTHASWLHSQLGQFTWLLLGGDALALFCLVHGLLCTILLFTAPLGRAWFSLARRSLHPFPDHPGVSSLRASLALASFTFLLKACLLAMLAWFMLHTAITTP